MNSTKWEITVDADQLEKLLFGFEVDDSHVLDFLQDQSAEGNVDAANVCEAYASISSQLNEFAEKHIDFDERH